MSITRHHCPKYKARTEPVLGDRGLSIYRPANKDALSEVFGTFECATKGIISRMRGIAIDKDAALSQLSLQEVKYNKPFIGHVAIKEVTDTLYAGVRSLRKPMKLSIARAALVGMPHNPLVTMALIFDKDGRDTVQEQRLQVLYILESYVGEMPGDRLPEEDEELRWFYREIPHVSIGKLPAETPQNDIIRIRGCIERVAPQELQIGRAIIHNPVQAN